MIAGCCRHSQTISFIFGSQGSLSHIHLWFDQSKHSGGGEYGASCICCRICWNSSSLGKHLVNFARKWHARGRWIPGKTNSLKWRLHIFLGLIGKNGLRWVRTWDSKGWDWRAGEEQGDSGGATYRAGGGGLGGEAERAGHEGQPVSAEHSSGPKASPTAARSSKPTCTAREVGSSQKGVKKLTESCLFDL